MTDNLREYGYEMTVVHLLETITQTVSQSVTGSQPVESSVDNLTVKSTDNVLRSRTQSRTRAA